MNASPIFPSLFSSLRPSRLTQVPKWFVATLMAFTFCAFTGATVHAAEPDASAEHQAQTVNINQASVEELTEMLQGVGAGKAQAIVDYRDSNGSFESIDQLTEVNGIGAATVEKNRGRLSL